MGGASKSTLNDSNKKEIEPVKKSEDVNTDKNKDKEENVSSDQNQNQNKKNDNINQH
jgi:hypothetical protein